MPTNRERIIKNNEDLNDIKSTVHDLPESLDTSDANATADKIIKGYSAYVNGEKINGNINVNSSYVDITMGTSSISTSSNRPYEIRIGYGRISGMYSNAGVYTWFNQQDLARRVGIDANVLKKGTTVLRVTGNFTGDATATSDDILENKTAYVNGNKVIGSMTDLGQLDITPTTTAQTIPAGYTSGGTVNAIPDETEVLNEQDDLLDTQEIKIADLVTALDNKIALDLTNATADANATASDIREGKTAYVNGEKVLGTLEGGSEIQFENGNMSGLNSALNSVLVSFIKQFIDYADTQRLETFLNEPITIYTPDINMQYFVINKKYNSNEYRIIWTNGEVGHITKDTYTNAGSLYCIKKLTYTTNNSQNVYVYNTIWKAMNYGYANNNDDVRPGNESYYSQSFNSLSALITAISNPESNITYTQPTGNSGYNNDYAFNVITNMVFWDGPSNETIVNNLMPSRKLSNNVTILPLNS